MANKNDTEIIIMAIFVGTVLALYFISNILFILGIVILVISFIVLLMGVSENDGQWASIGSIGLLMGIIFLAIGGTGINFFEHNPTGINLLNAANTVVNATKDIVKI